MPPTIARSKACSMASTSGEQWMKQTLEVGHLSGAPIGGAAEWDVAMVPIEELGRVMATTVCISPED
jgi:hypothetical protein